ncbi:MAG: OmpA family protein [Lachnospiraceae bacterium]|nr:OmpA family protein [Lachnospiraceae bacterium]MDD3794417.1 OmpA family protein [Lachnospiraceae bacterium]
MRKVNRRKMKNTESHNVWRSYSDMMSGLLLLFVLIMAVCLMQAQKNYTEKLNEQAKQMQTQNELDKTQGQLDEQQTTLDDQASQLADQASQLKAQQATLDEQKAQLTQKESDLAASQSTLDEQNQLLQTQESELAERDAALAASQSKLDEQTALMTQQQTKIDQIIGVKADLITALKDEFEANQISVEIDYQTGAIVLDSSVLFDYNESVLTDAGSSILAQVLPLYCKVLLGDQYVDYLAEVIIDGYTDTTGDYITNLDLSQRRAFAVAEYLMNSKDSFLSSSESERLTEKLTANGRSMSNPILNSSGEVDMDASRRVEIKFRLKDEEMLTELQQIIEESRTGTAGAETP